jgi:hypothetical protein
MRKTWFEDPERDPALAEALRRSEASRSLAVDDALRVRISLAARPALLARRLPARESVGTWWEWTAGWARLMVPAALTAVVVSALLLTREAGSFDVATAGATVAADTTSVSSVVLSAATLHTERAQVLNQILVPAEHDWLFTEAMGR